MNRLLAKFLVVLLIFVQSLICTLLPLKLKGFILRRGRKGVKVLSCMMCFGGGVFFATYALHMAPDVRLILETAWLKPSNIVYPIPELIISIGFFMMLFSEKIIQKCSKKHSKKKAVKNGGYNVVSTENVTTKNVQAMQATGVSCSTDPVIARKQNGESLNAVLQDNKLDADGYNLPGGHQHDLRGTRGLLLLMALSFHHVFEGLTIGLKHSVTGIWSLCIAVVSHEIVVAFSLGLQLTNAYKSTKKIVLAAVMCSAMVPLGAVIGISMMETGSGDSGSDNRMLIVNGVMQGLSSGVFLYVTFFEILYEEINDQDSSIFKLCCIVLGYAVLALLSLIPEDRGFEDLTTHDVSTFNYSDISRNSTYV